MPKIAFVIRDTDQLDENMPMIDDLNQSGVTVQVFLIGEMMPAAFHTHSEWEKRLKKPGIEFYSAWPGDLAPPGLHGVSRAEIARLITRADMVIPL